MGILLRVLLVKVFPHEMPNIMVGVCIITIALLGRICNPTALSISIYNAQ